MAKNLKEKLVMEVEAPSTCNRVFSFTVPCEAAAAENDRMIGYISGVAQLPGFRAGKAPRNIVAKKYANEIKEELRNLYVQTAVELIYEEKNQDVIGINFKDMGEVKPGEEFKFSFSVTVAPEFEIGDYNAIKVEIPLDAVEESAVEERLKFYRNMYGKYNTITTPAEAGDMLKVDYKSDFELAEDATASLKRQAAAESAFIWLNEPETIPGCIAALTGAEAGKEYSFTAEYPADYREAELAGKSLNYTVAVKEVQRRGSLSDEELEKTLGQPVEKVKEIIRESLESEAKNKRRQSAGEEILNRLNETAGDFEVPQDMVEMEIQKELQRVAREKVTSEEEAEKFKAELEEHRKAVADKAKLSVRNTLILRKIARLENIDVDDDEVNSQISNMSQHYGYKTKEMREMMEKSGSMADFRVDLLKTKVLDKLVDSAL